MTWGVDFTTTARSDLVGLDSDVMTTIIDALVEWSKMVRLAVIDAR